MKKYAPGFWIMLLLLASCHYDESYKDVRIGNEFSVSMPGWTEPQDDLAPGAPLQYANRYRNFYTVGFVTAKDTLGKDFRQSINSGIDSLKAYMDKSLVTDSTSVEIDGLSGVRVELLGHMKEEKIYFSEVYLDAPSRIYHLSVWTRGEERKLKYKEDIDSVIRSFKLLTR